VEGIAFDRRRKHSSKERANDVLSDFTPFLSRGEELLEALLMPGLCESVVVAMLFRGRLLIQRWLSYVRMTYCCSKEREGIAKKSRAGSGVFGAPKWAMVC
jgi:hypothetical protein